MKKIIIIFISLFSVLFSFTVVQAEDSLLQLAQEAGYPATIDMLPKSSIVVDAENGNILWADHINLKWDPASTTKIMVVYLAFEAINRGEVTLDTEIVANQTDQAIASIYALSNNKIVSGQSYSVRDLISMTLVPSSNVATLMLAHLIHKGDDASFLKLMNDVAKKLGMEDTTFYNATGAIANSFEGLYIPTGVNHDRANESTAKDLAILSYHLIKKYSQVLSFTNKSIVTAKEGTPYEETFHTYNHSLPGASMGIEGVDGLKTGSSPTAAYNIVVSAKRGDRRFIVVVLGASQWGNSQGEFIRHYFVNALLETSFSDFSRKKVASKGVIELDGEKFELKEDFYSLVKNGEEVKLDITNNRLHVVNANGTIDTKAGMAVTEVPNLLENVLYFIWQLVKFLFYLLLFLLSAVLILLVYAFYRKLKRKRVKKIK